MSNFNGKNVFCGYKKGKMKFGKLPMLIDSSNLNQIFDWLLWDIEVPGKSRVSSATKFSPRHPGEFVKK